MTETIIVYPTYSLVKLNSRKNNPKISIYYNGHTVKRLFKWSRYQQQQQQKSIFYSKIKAMMKIHVPSAIIRTNVMWQRNKMYAQQMKIT